MCVIAAEIHVLSRQRQQHHHDQVIPPSSFPLVLSSAWCDDRIYVAFVPAPVASICPAGDPHD